jgi:hypothetical protein
MVDALPRDMSEWRLAEALAKCAEEMPTAESCNASKIIDSDSGADVG